jgi:predicted phosphoribosyltransferase
MGAIATGGVRVLNDDVVDALAVPPQILDVVAAREGEELERRERAYRGDRPPVDVADRVVILVDDGMATGATMRAAVAAVQLKGPARVVVAVPTGAAAACEMMREVADEVVCVSTPEPFLAVGTSYDDFSATSDDEVRQLLS